MPKIIACFKWVVDEAYIRRGSSGMLDFSSVDFKISDYDRNAIEESVRLKGNHGGEVIAMTVGIPEATKGIKDALSRGPDQACFIVDEAFSNIEPSQTAAILAEVIRTRFADYSLILCGEGSSDIYAQQVGARLAEHLDIPCISFAQKVEIDGRRVVVERRVEEGVEIAAASLPALVTVLPDINVPRIPGVKDTLTASKKPVMTIRSTDLSSFPEAFLKTIDVKAASMDRVCEKFTTDTADILRLVETLRRKAVIT